MTRAIARACPFMPRRSRPIFRSRVLIGSPPELPRQLLPLVAVFLGHEAGSQADYTVGHVRNIRIVRDEDGRCTKLPVDPLESLENDDPRGEIERPCRLVA